MQARRRARHERRYGRPSGSSGAGRPLRLCAAGIACAGLLLFAFGLSSARAESGGAAAAEAVRPREGPSEPLQQPLRVTLLAGGVRLIVDTTVGHIDLDELRANAIEKLEAKDEAEYRRQMNRIFDDLESVDVFEVHGIKRESSRAQVIAALKGTDQQTIRDALDAIPDPSIANLVERKLREKGVSSLAEAHGYLQTELTEFVASLSG